MHPGAALGQGRRRRWHVGGPGRRDVAISGHHLDPGPTEPAVAGVFIPWTRQWRGDRPSDRAGRGSGIGGHLSRRKVTHAGGKTEQTKARAKRNSGPRGQVPAPRLLNGRSGSRADLEGAASGCPTAACWVAAAWGPSLRGTLRRASYATLPRWRSSKNARSEVTVTQDRRRFRPDSSAGKVGPRCRYTPTQLRRALSLAAAFELREDLAERGRFPG